MRNTNDKGSSRLGVALWVVQSLLTLTFLFAGGSKFVLPAAVLTGPSHISVAFIRFVGALELLGGFGLILPGLIRLRAELTPLAAGGLIMIMSAAVGVTMATGPAAPALVPAIVGFLLAFVAIGRWKLAPHEARAARGGARSLSLQAAS